MSLANVIKKAGVGAVNATMPVNLIFGTVTSDSPLEITTEQKLKLSKEFLVLTKNVTDYELEVSIDMDSESASGGSGYAEFASHTHKLKGKKKVKIHNKLKTGDKVILARMQGGQDFVVLDRSAL